MRQIAWLFWIAAGCGDGLQKEQASITSFPELNLDVTDGRWTATLGDGETDYEPGPCPVVRSDLVAHVGELELTVVEPGDAVPDFDGGHDCVSPQLGGEIPPRSGPAQLELRDGLGAVTCEVPDLTAVQMATLVPAGPWEFHAGLPVRLRWLPGPDLHIMWVSALVRSATDSPSAGVDVQGDLLALTLPTLAPGAYQLEIHTVSTLSGVVCAADASGLHIPSRLTTSFSQPITIVP